MSDQTPYRQWNTPTKLQPGDMAGQPKYKIGWRGKPFYQDALGDWILSNRPIQEVKAIIQFQQNPKRENYVWAKVNK
jgi:hypothetical protein